MRAYSISMLLGLILMVSLGLLLSASPITTPEISAEVDIAPEVLNLKRMDTRNGIITAYVRNLTKEDASYEIHEINMSTLGLYYENQLIVNATHTRIENDTLIAKFDATQVANYIWTYIVYHMGTVPPQADYTITLTVSGQLIGNGDSFAGSDTVKIIYP